MSTKQLKPEQYTIGWVSALPEELQMARAMLDEEHPPIKTKAHNDQNSYVLGCIGDQNVVMACLPAGRAYSTSATVVASHMLSTFTSLKLGLMVGIGGAAPSSKNDIRLGDIVVSQPDGTFGGVVQYDLGKEKGLGGFERKGTLNSPPSALLNALSKIQSQLEDPQFPEFIAKAGTRYRRLASKTAYPGSDIDILYKSDYPHPKDEGTCDECDKTKRVMRKHRPLVDNVHLPEVFYGTIASGNRVLKDALTRDELQKELGVLCFEMEAAGLMNDFPCLVIRGISDYCDSHKNDDWHGYAAAVAAAFAKEFLLTLDPQDVGTTAPIKGTTF